MKDDPEVKAPPKAAGGMAAVVSTAHHLHKRAALWRGGRALLSVNQPQGFDCPGCAWPEPNDGRPLVEVCENGAKAIAVEATSRRVDADFFARHSLEDLLTRSDAWLTDQGRLTQPMVLRGDAHYRPIGWDEAFSLIARELHALASPDEAVFYTSGRTSNEAAFLYQAFVRRFGTNNLPDCSDLCHESSGVAMRQALGWGKGTVALEDFAYADAIFVIGQNPGTNHPRMMTTLQEAALRGCRIVSINPLPEVALSRFAHPQRPLDLVTGGTPIATLHLPVRINGDVAALKGIMKGMLERGAVDQAFIAAHTEGFAALEAALHAQPWEELEAASGLTRAQMEQAVEVAATSRRIIACWAMGLTQHKNAVANVQEVLNFLLLGGNLGRPGAGACPVRGHSNVQGDRTMGIAERMDDGFLERLGQSLRFTPPRAPGLDTIGAIEAMRAGQVKAFIALGGNFLSATPDTTITAEALRRCALTVQVSTTLNRAHLVTGRTALILPCLTRSEVDVQEGGPQFVTVEDSMSNVHASAGVLPPASSQLRSEPAIVAGLANAVLGVDWSPLVANYDRIRDAIAAVVPGFEQFNERARLPYGFTLPNPVRERRFLTPSGRALFTVHPLPWHRLAPGQLLMMTIRSHDQYNTTVYGLDDRYRGVRGGRRVVLMNEADIAGRGLTPGDTVDLHSHHRGEVRTAPAFMVVPYAIPVGCAATYFPEANVLVPLSSVADGSRTPTSKSVVITVTATAPAAT